MIDPANPFDDSAARAHSNYCRFDGTRLVRSDGADPTPLTQFVHDGFRALTLNERFTCVGAKAAVRRGAYGFGLYKSLGELDVTAGLSRDLYTFVHDVPELSGEFSSFVASFEGPVACSEPEFERLLWTTLQRLHDGDAPCHRWDNAVSDDPSDPAFAFSFAGTAFFIVGLHAASSRAARRFAWPTLVFNPHRQFDRLRESQQFSRFQHVIREAERNLQGSINPMLADFGDRSEASQYSGRRVAPDWKCPFSPHPPGPASESE